MRTARRHGKSWTEIATMLAITRQSAWERWRDLDDADRAGTRPAAPGSSRPSPNELSGRARRRRNVAVPDVVGFSTPDALGILTRAGFDAVSATPDSDTARVTRRLCDRLSSCGSTPTPAPDCRPAPRSGCGSSEAAARPVYANHVDPARHRAPHGPNATRAPAKQSASRPPINKPAADQNGRHGRAGRRTAGGRARR